MSRKALFSGEGYLASTAKITPFDNFEGGLNFRTLQPTGLLFYHSEGVLTFQGILTATYSLLHCSLLTTAVSSLRQPDELSISLENGAVVMSCRGTRVKSHKKQYNDGRTHFLVASVNKQK